jgi:hypothetical protein
MSSVSSSVHKRSCPSTSSTTIIIAVNTFTYVAELVVALQDNNDVDNERPLVFFAFGLVYKTGASLKLFSNML